MDDLTVIIPVLNDRAELLETVRSVRSTGFTGELIVIDDASVEPQRIEEDLAFRLIRNEERQGVAKNRHLGTELAKSKWVLFLDSHMRMDPNWLAEFDKLKGLENTLINGTCLGMTPGHKDITKPQGVYAGATLLVLNRGTQEILEGKWVPEVAEGTEIPCCMGAIYFIPRDFFLEIGGLKTLCSWGSDEPYLSSKVWMAGGRVVQSRGIRAGHVFRNAAPYHTVCGHLLFNKFAMVREIVDESKVQASLLKFITEQPHFKDAKQIVINNFLYLNNAAARFNAVRKRSFMEFCDHFKLSLAQV